MDGFLLKKIVSQLVHVVPGAIVLLLALLLLQWRYRKVATLGLWLVTFSLLALSSPPVANALVDSLERQYAPLERPPVDTALILVLGYGHDWAPHRSATSVLMAGALSRLTEAVRLWKMAPGATLVVSGAPFLSTISHADAMAAAANELGVPDSAIARLDTTRDTSDEVEQAVRLLRNRTTDSAAGGQAVRDQLIVVSSATHLPRAAMLLNEIGVNYQMAPTDFLVLENEWFRFDAHYLYAVNRALHEYVGVLWLQLRRAMI